MTKYLIDTSVLTQANRLYYAFDICPLFWNILALQAKQENILSIDKVRDELNEGNDYLKEWIKTEIDKDFFKSTNNTETVTNYGEIIQYVQGLSGYSPAAKSDFYSSLVDAWLIAYAKAKGYTVVTQEALNPIKKNKIRIPAICRSLSIPVIDTFDLLRALNVKLE
jgi:hypothetical protein